MALRTPLDTSFMRRGLCLGLSDLFFPPGTVTGKQRSKAYAKAQEICVDCPVRAECLQWALLEPHPIEGGVVGGLTPLQLVEARKAHIEVRRENYQPKCGTERGLVWHLKRGETCTVCLDAHNRKGQRYAEAS